MTFANHSLLTDDKKTTTSISLNIETANAIFLDSVNIIMLAQVHSFLVRIDFYRQKDQRNRIQNTNSFKNI